MSTLSQNIVFIRKEVMKLTQGEFAEYFHLTRAKVASYESGKAQPKTETLLSIAKNFNITIGDLCRKNLQFDGTFLRSQNQNPPIKPTNDPTNISKSEKSLVDLKQNQFGEGQIQYQSTSPIGDKREIEHLKAELQKKELLLEDKEERIKELKDHIKTLNNRITDMEERMEELKSAKFSTKMPVLETVQP